MTRPDDSTLDPEDLRAVEDQAQRLLDRADAWDRYPVPVDDILSAAKVRLARTSAFDPAAIVSYLRGKTTVASAHIRSAITKVFGLYDAAEALIHIDNTVAEARQTFVTLHETGHHDIPTHRKMFRIFQDCEKTLSPDIADRFEREANNFARFLLFKGTTFAEHAADCRFEIKTPMKLAKTFGASIYASAREFARTNARECVVFVLQPLETNGDSVLRAPVRRIEPSPAYVARFGRPILDVPTPDHPLWPAIPIGRKMTKAVPLTITDLNGQRHESLAEAFDTTYNVLILLYPVTALTTTVTVPLHPNSPISTAPFLLQK